MLDSNVYLSAVKLVTSVVCISAVLVCAVPHNTRHRRELGALDAYLANSQYQGGVVVPEFLRELYRLETPHMAKSKQHFIHILFLTIVRLIYFKKN